MITQQNILDKHFHLSNQDGNVDKKGVINQPTISRYGLHGKNSLMGMIMIMKTPESS